MIVNKEEESIAVYYLRINSGHGSTLVPAVILMVPVFPVAQPPASEGPSPQRLQASSRNSRAWDW